MKKTRKWNIIHNKEVSLVDEVISVMLENRGLTKKEEIEHFLHPKLSDVTIESVGIDTEQLDKTIKRLKKAIKEKEKIIVFGDYDVDGITGTAILWETLHGLSANVVPYIPHRVDEGYGLSIKGIDNVLEQNPDTKIIMTVDNGIVANAATDYANSKGIEVIITDHHTRSDTVPNAFAIVHTTKLCGAGVGWMLSQELKGKKDTEHLDLVSLATVADLVPLTGANRAILKNGLPFLQQTKRIGLLELFAEAGINPNIIGVYEIGHIIGPRLNAMGRLESAMDSLRLLCTKDPNRARILASQLGITNKERQLLTQAASMHAIAQFKTHLKLKNVLFIASETYEEGIIGLVAGKLVEEYYRPAIVLSIGEKVSKASARSVSGVNIIEFIRSSSNLLLNAGGHPMAAGFSVETEKIAVLKEVLEKLSEEIITEEHLTPILKIDVTLPLKLISQKLYDTILQLAPFGMANTQPVFVSKKVTLEDIRVIGQTKKHVKFKITQDNSLPIDAIAFNMADSINPAKNNKTADIVYTIDENIWNGRKTLQLKVKDINLH
ncbi:MAG TPA: single-stranded-DNA-specific exonuclease RecJ [Patescibacteria group bacterium]